MKSLQEISNTFHVAHDEYKQHVFEVNARAERMKQAALRYQRLAAQKMGESNKIYNNLNAERGVHWTDNLLRPLLVEIEERTGWEFDNKDDLRTFGLRAECPVHIWDGTVNEHGFRNYKAYLTFTPHIIRDNDKRTFELYYDTGEKNGCRYDPDSIGAMNGFDNKTAKVESVEQVIDFLQRQMNEAA